MIERITQITIVPDGHPIYAESAFVIQVEDDAGGEFLSIQCHNDQCAQGQIRLDPQEWPALRDAIDRMVKECRS